MAEIRSKSPDDDINTEDAMPARIEANTQMAL